MDVLADCLKILGSAAAAGLAFAAVARARALNRRIREHFEEQETEAADPYARMAALAQIDSAGVQRREERTWPRD